ncbi:hypothetical protein MSG28_001118 [Choristoneura fumiferana]|uniref:Uncharacterized protein n=1 Tax=Choristoneura fumiferana TaxID=7141 RepID=A0ACC0K464_CHOFU|nr:hypothetical protein MSG28_001118 [Choristoneura fumiferana]
MSVVKKVAAMRQLDSMFGNMNLEGRRSPLVSSIVEHDPHCDVHGRHACSSPYRSSLYLHSSRESSPGYYRESVSPSNGLIIRRKDSLGISGSPAREMEHPSTFPSILRRPHSPSVTPPRRETPSPTQRYSNKRHSMGSFPNLSKANIVNYNRRDSLSSNGIRDMKRDYVGSTNSLSRKSSIDTKKSSTDSLDNWHSNWESDRHNFVPTIAPEERLSFGFKKRI